MLRVIFNCKNSAEFLWTAPELLRLPSVPDEGTQKGDVYRCVRNKNALKFLLNKLFGSFAIIVQEIVSRQGVFYLGSTYLDRTPKGELGIYKICKVTLGRKLQSVFT